MFMKHTVFAISVAAAAARAIAQTPCPDGHSPVGDSNCLTNPSFEAVNPFSSSGEPQGWHNISNPAYARRRTVGDGLTPTLLPVGTPVGLTPHSGSACIQLSTAGSGGFIGFTTD